MVRVEYHACQQQLRHLGSALVSISHARFIFDSVKPTTVTAAESLSPHETHGSCFSDSEEDVVLFECWIMEVEFPNAMTFRCGRAVEVK